MRLTRRQLRRIIREAVGSDPSRLSQGSIDRQRAYDVFNALQDLQAGGDIDPYGTTVTWDRLELEHSITQDDVDLLARFPRYNLRRQPYIRVTPQGIEFTAEGGYWEVG